MAKSAVFTQPSRIFFPVAGASMGLAMVYGAFTGDWLGITLYLLLVCVASFAGVVVAGFRVNDAPEWIAPDADPPAYHEVARAPLPAGGAWPFTAALAVTLLLLGFVVGPLAAYFGLGLGLVTVAGWLARVSADTTGRQINLMPIGIPVLGLFCIAALMFFMSRILLAVPEMASTWIALAVAVVILGLATLLALRPTIKAGTMVSVHGRGRHADDRRRTGGGGGRRASHRAPRRGRGGTRAGRGRGGGQGHPLRPQGDDPAPSGRPRSSSRTTTRASPTTSPSTAGPTPPPPPFFKGDIIAGPAELIYHFTTPAAGEYYFQCDVHPNMNGKAKVA